MKPKKIRNNRDITYVYCVRNKNNLGLQLFTFSARILRIVKGLAGNFSEFWLFLKRKIFKLIFV